MKFNKKLTVLREEKGMNMTEFAKLLGTSKQVIARYEKGENTPKITTVAHYAKVLGVSLQYLINDECTDRTGIIPSQKNTPDEQTLTEGEKMWLELYHRLSDKTREILIESLDSFDNLTVDQQELALDLWRVALRQKK